MSATTPEERNILRKDASWVAQDCGYIREIYVRDTDGDLHVVGVGLQMEPAYAAASVRKEESQ